MAARTMELDLPRTVSKPWGHELIFAHTSQYVGKILHIQRGHRLSLQYHKIKHETIYLDYGWMELETEGENGRLTIRELLPGETVRIRPRVNHRMRALEDCVVLEASTPHLEDVVRLSDDHGRKAEVS